VAEEGGDFSYRIMTWEFAVRDLLAPRRKILEEAGISPGFHVLDFGCGPGSYVPDTSEMVGISGRVYALDVHPMAVQKVKRLVEKKGMSNVEIIQSDCATGLENHSVDVVLLYDTFHDLNKAQEILAELHRVLKPDGKLSFSDHHLKEDAIVSGVAGGGLFRLVWKNRKTYTFCPSR